MRQSKEGQRSIAGRLRCILGWFSVAAMILFLKATVHGQDHEGATTQVLETAGATTGGSLGIPSEWLQGSPFSDYLAPGLILFLVLGIGPLIVASGLWTRHRWAWHAALLVSMALLVWIGVEVIVIGYQARPPLQLIYGVLGLLMLGLVMLPSVREYLVREVQAA